MRKLIVIVAAAALSACSGGPDFTMEVDGKAAEIESALGDIDANMIPRQIGLKSVVLTRPEPGTLLYTIPGQKGAEDGTIAFAIKDTGKSSSQITVDVDLPMVRTELNNKAMVLSESKVERSIKRDLRNWADRRAGSTSGAGLRTSLGTTIGGLAVVLQHPDDLEKVARGLGGTSLAGLDLESGSTYRRDHSDYGSADDPEPMSDPNADAREYDPDRSASAYDPDVGGWGNESY